MRRAILLLLTALLSSVFAISDADVEAFFTQTAANLAADYSRCTGDTAAISQDSLLRWMRTTESRFKDPAFAKMRREYMEATGNIKGFSTCDILTWIDARMVHQRRTEDSLKSAVHEADDRSIDSVLYRQECDANPPSWSDYSNIPFGLSRMAFRIAFEEHLHQPLFEKEDAFYQEQVPIAGEPFLVSFTFNRAGRYCAYRIESYDIPGREFDSRVRGQTNALIEWFSEATGHPAEKIHFSIMEIHPDTLAVQARWLGSREFTEAGILLTGSRYRAVLQMRRTDLSDKQKPLR